MTILYYCNMNMNVKFACFQRKRGEGDEHENPTADSPVPGRPAADGGSPFCNLKLIKNHKSKKFTDINQH